MFFRRRNRDTEQSWAKWLLIAFLVYAVISYQRPGTPDSPNKIRETVSGATDLYDQINFDDYKEKLFPKYVAALRVNDVEIGTGLPAVCGQEAVIAYETFLPDGSLFDDKATRKNPMRFVLGGHKAMPVFEEGIIGMQKGGRRSLLAPPNMAYGAEGFRREGIPADALLRFEVTLLDISPAIPDPEKTPYRIAITRNGIGSASLCGEEIKVQVEIWDASGKKLYSTKEGEKGPLVFTPGKSQVFLGLEQGVIGMKRGENRTIIVPPSFQNTLRKEKPELEIPLPENQTVIVDVEFVP